MMPKYLAADNILKSTDYPYKIKERPSKLYWKWNSIQLRMWKKKTSEISIWYTRLAVGANIPQGNAIIALFMGTLLEFGASIRISLRYIHKLSICSCKPNKMFSHHLRLSSLNFPNYCRLKISCRLYKRRLCSASDVLLVLSLVSSSAYLTRLLSPAFLSGLLQLLSF